MRITGRPLAGITAIAVAAGLAAVTAPGDPRSGCPGARLGGDRARVAGTALGHGPVHTGTGALPVIHQHGRRPRRPQSLTRANSSETAAVARAAHDVLVEYFPAASGTLDGTLAYSLALIPDGPAKPEGSRSAPRRPTNSPPHESATAGTIPRSSTPRNRTSASGSTHDRCQWPGTASSIGSSAADPLPSTDQTRSAAPPTVRTWPRSKPTVAPARTPTRPRPRRSLTSRHSRSTATR